MPKSTTMQDRSVIQLFAKYPHPGTVKTRLIDALGSQLTTELYKELLERQLDTVYSMSPEVAVELWGTEAHSSNYYQYCQQRWSAITYHRQIAGDLGQKMGFALSTSLHHCSAVLQTGTDCPALTREHLTHVLQRLYSGYDVVFIPAEDGGYVLAGYRRYVPGMFDNIEWGTENALNQSREQLASLGLTVNLLPALWDVDRPEDVTRYRKLVR